MKGGPIYLVNIVILIMLLFMPSLAQKAQLCTRVTRKDDDTINVSVFKLLQNGSGACH
jgi:hypothetical protein